MNEVEKLYETLRKIQENPEDISSIRTEREFSNCLRRSWSTRNVTGIWRAPAGLPQVIVGMTLISYVHVSIGKQM